MKRSLFLFFVAAWLLLLVLLVFSEARAHGPEDTDPAMADWFRSLVQPDLYGSSCCNDKDCHVVARDDMQIRDEMYWIKDPDVHGRVDWIAVPPEKILKRYDNPTGKYVACVINHMVLCFVKAAGI